MRSFYLIASAVAFIFAAAMCLVIVFCFDESVWSFQTWQCADNVEQFDPYVCFGADLLDPLVPTSKHEAGDGLIRATAGALSPYSSYVHFTLELMRNTQHEYISKTFDLTATAHVNVTWHDHYPAVEYPDLNGNPFIYAGRANVHTSSAPLHVSCPAWNALCQSVPVYRTPGPLMPFVTLGMHLSDITISHYSGYKLFNDAVLKVSIMHPAAALARLTLAGVTLVSVLALAGFLAYSGDKSGLLAKERRPVLVILGLTGLYSLQPLSTFIPTPALSNVLTGCTVVLAGAISVSYWVVSEYTIATLDAFRDRLRRLPTHSTSPAATRTSLSASRIELREQRLSSTGIVLGGSALRYVLPHVAIGLACVTPAFAMQPILETGVGVTTALLLAVTAVQAARLFEKGRARIEIAPEDMDDLTSTSASASAPAHVSLPAALSAAPSSRTAIAARRSPGDLEEAPVSLGLARTPSMLALIDRTGLVEAVDVNQGSSGDESDSLSDAPSARRALPLQLASALTARLPYALLWSVASAAALIVAYVIVGDFHYNAPVFYSALSFFVLGASYVLSSVLMDDALRVRGAVKAGVWDEMQDPILN